jgi:ATP-dependent protease ClpP protease subunit
MLKILSVLSLMLCSIPGLAKEVLLTRLNTVNIRTNINPSSMTTASIKLAQLVKERGRSPYTIYIVLDSPGGSIVAGEDFIQFAKMYQNVETISLFSASMAATIVQSLPGKRNITSNGVIMFHRASGRFSGQFEEGEVESQLNLWKSIIREIDLRVSRRLNMNLDAFKAKIANEWWSYGQSAVDENVADQVVTVRCSPELIEEREARMTEGLFGAVKSMVSACPMIRGIIEAGE